MAKILFINPVIREEDDPKHVPYGIALLAALAIQKGHKVQVYDANGWRLGDEALREAIEADEWDVIASGCITTGYGSLKKIVQCAKQYAPRAVVVVGGGVLTSMPFEIMTFLPQVDVGIVGEAFVTLLELLERIDRRERDWSAVKGVIYRAASGELQLTEIRPLIGREALDQLPYPAWELFPLELYWKHSQLLYSEEAFTSKRRLDINASYGCSLICRFCFHLGITGDLNYTNAPGGKRDVEFTYKREIRWHSAEYVVRMVRYMRDRFGVDFVLFLDENLMTMNSYSHWTWLPEVAKAWIDAGLQPSCRREKRPHDTKCRGVHWGGTSHATLVRKDLLKILFDSGCSQLLYGYESFSDRILRNVGKGTTAALNERSLKWTIEAGIRPIPNQIIGFPDEFFDSIRDSVRAWERMGIVVKPFFATPYPGSEWYYTYKDRILEQYNGDLEAFLLDLGDATKITAVISENFNAVELLGLRELMVNRDLKHIDEYERLWRSRHGEPFIPDFRRFPRVQAKDLRVLQTQTPSQPVVEEVTA
ncbi:MAG: B12-binding domain-containing radical SAM protein [Candidatus Omnitrophica bacterium]|nr:B12-binding domain-containing radical SAM protein [Candidatus Omnitrophota bacterium]